MAKKKSFTERRRKPRAPLEVDATAVIEGETYRGNVTEISVGGLSLVCRDKVKNGSVASLEFFLPDSQEPLQMTATVEGIRFTEEGHVWRLKFVKPNYRVIGEIEQHVRQHLVSKAREKYQSKPPPGGKARKGKRKAKRQAKGSGGGLSGFIKKVFKKD
jgi:hypothetical protein